MNLSAILEGALEETVRLRPSQEWLEENRQAIRPLQRVLRESVGL